MIDILINIKGSHERGVSIGPYATQTQLNPNSFKRDASIGFSHGKVSFNEPRFLNTRLGAGCFVLVKMMKSLLCSTPSRPLQSDPPTDIAASIILPQGTLHSLTSLYTSTGYNYGCVGFKITFGPVLNCGSMSFILNRNGFHTTHIFHNWICFTEKVFYTFF